MVVNTSKNIWRHLRATAVKIQQKALQCSTAIKKIKISSIILSHLKHENKALLKQLNFTIK